MRKKLVVLFAVLLTVVLLFAACGEDNKPTEEHVHDYGEFILEVGPTCTTAGTKGHYHCSGCNKDFDGDKNEITDLAIPATGHTDGGWVTDTEATCTTAGSKHQICSVCHATLKTEEIPVTAHTEGEWVTVTAATCTTAGSKRQVCAVCNATLKTEEIPATGHTEGEWIIDTEATCTEDGGKHQICAACGETLATEVIPAAGHTEGEWIVDTEATCTEDGVKHQICATCGETLATEVIPAAGHAYTWVEEEPANCGYDGVKGHYVCGTCGAYFDEEYNEITAESLVIPATGHGNWKGENIKYVQKKKATCGAAGVEAHYHCSVCGKDYNARKVEVSAEELIIPTLEHTPGAWVHEQAATCTEPGRDVRLCAECLNVMDERAVPALGHNYGTWIPAVAATSETHGVKGHYHCDRCGLDFDENYHEITDLTLHDYQLQGGYREIRYEGDTPVGITSMEDAPTQAHYFCQVCGKFYDLKYHEIEEADLQKETAIAIRDSKDMLALAKMIDDGNSFADKTFKLTNDIDMTGTGFNGLGKSANGNNARYFSGSFDGQGHTINITQAQGDADGNAGFINLLRVPANGTCTIENIHVVGTVTATCASEWGGYIGGLIGDVDAGFAGNGGTVNVVNCWVSTYLNLKGNRHWAIGGMIGFTRHESGLKPLTVNIDSCLWDGTLNNGPAVAYGGGIIGYTGNNNAGRTLNINISNTLVAGKIMTNQTYDEIGLIVGYVKGSTSDNATAKATVTVSNVVSSAYITYVKENNNAICGMFGKIDGTTELNLTNFYYKPFNIKRATSFVSPLVGVGTATSQNGVVPVTQADLANLTDSSFSTASKWVFGEDYCPCPDGIVTTFGYPEELKLPHSHVLSAWYEEVPATEETAGVKGHYVCLKCGKYLAANGETEITDLTISSIKLTISSAEELAAFRDSVNSGATYEGETVKLTANIDLAGMDWTAIGTSSNPFKGNFDGQGHTISNLTQSRENAIASNVGLFGYVSSADGGSATIQNFKLTGSITGKKGGEGAGTVISYILPSATGTVTVNVKNIWSTVNFTAEGATMKGVGGIVCSMAWKTSDYMCTLNVDSCRYSGTLDSADGYGSNDYSGIIGWARENACPRAFNVSNCLFDGVITLRASSPDDNGGIMGYLKGNQNETPISVNINNCIVAGQFNHPNKENYAVTGYVLSECSKKTDTNTAYTVTNVYYCNDADRHTGADLGGWYGYYKKGDGAISPLITYENVTAKTMDELSTMTEGFADDTAWDFGTETEIPVSKTLVDAFGR